jgi:hypothetical protein
LKLGKDAMTTIDDILRVFEEIKTGDISDPDDGPLLTRMLAAFDDAKDHGLTASELVSALLGRKLTKEEDDYVFTKTELAEGSA